MSGPSSWRDTALPVRLWVFDAVGFVPFLAVLFRPAWSTFFVALAASVFLLLMSHLLGYSVTVMLRRLRSRIAGPVKAGVAWWHRPQKNLYPYRNPFREG